MLKHAIKFNSTHTQYIYVICIYIDVYNQDGNRNKLIWFNIFKEESIAYLGVYLYFSFCFSISRHWCSMSCFSRSRAPLCIFGKISIILACFRNKLQVVYSSFPLLTFSPFSHSFRTVFIILVPVAIFSSSNYLSISSLRSFALVLYYNQITCLFANCCAFSILHLHLSLRTLWLLGY